MRTSVLLVAHATCIVKVINGGRARPAHVARVHRDEEEVSTACVRDAPGRAAQPRLHDGRRRLAAVVVAPVAALVCVGPR